MQEGFRKKLGSYFKTSLFLWQRVEPIRSIKRLCGDIAIYLGSLNERFYWGQWYNTFNMVWIVKFLKYKNQTNKCKIQLHCTARALACVNRAGSSRQAQLGWMWNLWSRADSCLDSNAHFIVPHFQFKWSRSNSIESLPKTHRFTEE